MSLPSAARGAFERARSHYQPDTARLAALRVRVLEASASARPTPEVPDAWPAASASRPWAWHAHWGWMLSGLSLLVVVVAVWGLANLDGPPATPVLRTQSATSARPSAERPARGLGASSTPASAPAVSAGAADRRAPPPSDPPAAGSSSDPPAGHPATVTASSPAREPATGDGPATGRAAARGQEPEDRGPRLEARAMRSPTRQGAKRGASAGPDLAAEVQLLARARRGLRNGNFDDAARALAQHGAAHPAGQLHAERLALVAQLACSTGRLEEADRALEALRHIGAAPSLVGAAERACERAGDL